MVNKSKKYRKDAKINKEKKTDYNYYGIISRRLKYLKMLLSALLFVGVCAGFIFIEELTLQNINMLWRYIDILPAGRVTASEFRIDTDEFSRVGFHRNNIAVLRRSRLEIYDTGGRRRSVFQLAYSHPVLRISERYILAYDLGANQLDIFSTVAHVFEYSGEYPIFNARVTDRGFIAYVTRATGYRSVIRVLNNNFAEMYAVHRVNDFIMDADIDERANWLVAAGYYARGGDYISSILLYSTDLLEPVAEIEIQGELAYRVNLNERGFSVLLENSIRFYDLRGVELGRYNLAGRTLQLFEMGGKLSALVLSERVLGSDGRILIFNNDGSIIWEQTIGAEIIDIKFCVSYDYLYFLTRAGLYKINIESGTFELFVARINEYGEAGYDETTRSIIFADGRNIILAGLSRVNILER